MIDPKEKTGPAVPTREPKKKTPGIFDNLRKIPQPHPVEEMLGLVTPADDSGSRPSTHSRKTSRSNTSSSVSPERDFTKVANSIVRAAVPAGIFGENGGKSKQLYDYLYSQTRGAVVPRRTIRMPKDKLMKGAGIGSEVTLRKNLQRLRETGLIREEMVAGTHGGNEYEVLMPEEVGLTGSTPSTPSTPSRGSNTCQLREGLPPLEARGSSTSLSSDNATTYSKYKTFLKDLRANDDDEAFAGLIAQLKNAAQSLTGKAPTITDRERWAELGELLVTELRIAGARTTVSNAPAFLTEHLRRRLWKKDKQQLDAEYSEHVKTTEQPTLTDEEVKSCQDCGGSGWWYPEGLEKGVAKCKHSNLKKDSSTI